MSKTDSTLTAARVRELLEYDPDTGVLTWRRHRNKAKVGRPAGWLSAGNAWSGHRVKIDGREYYAHRLIWLYVHGVWPVAEIDHINRNPTDNRLCNLRAADRCENGANRGRQVNNQSGVTGVSWDARRGKWTAYLYSQRRRNYLGAYKDFAEAVSARMAAENHVGWLAAP